MNICDHCGEVHLALTIWPDEIHHTCPCNCHKAKLADRERYLNNKKNKKKKK